MCLKKRVVACVPGLLTVCGVLAFRLCVFRETAQATPRHVESPGVLPFKPEWLSLLGCAVAGAQAANEDALVLKDAECAQAISQKEEQFRIGLVDAENKTALARQRQVRDMTCMQRLSTLPDVSGHTCMRISDLALVFSGV